MRRLDRRRRQTEDLIVRFPELVDLYDETTPFNRSGQLDLHRRTIEIRRQHASVTDALADAEFIESLHATLQSWGIGVRASVLVPVQQFGAALLTQADVFSWLEQTSIDDPAIDLERTTTLLWQLISHIDIVENKAKLVALSKTIHHVLPDLLPPIDRAYTQKFFLWHPAEFQDQQELVFRSLFQDFVTIASHVEPSQFVGPGWRTSRTKVIDNAIVAFVKESRATSQPATSSAARLADPARLSDNFTTGELHDKIEEFRRVLEAAGLKPNTVDTYAGRSKTFVDWLAGRYEPQGPHGESE